MARAHLAGVTALLLALAACAEEPTEPEVPRSGGFSCVAAGDTGTRHCARIAEDITRRAPLDEAGRRRAEEVAAAVQRTTSLLGSCPVAEAKCATSAPRPPTADDVTALTRELTAKGLTTTARLAAADDPAPTGSLLYAVDVEPGACVVGHLTAIPGGGAGHYVAGHLPEGGCLTP
ncbi:hypothetical protein [Saccharothrix stipae]